MKDLPYKNVSEMTVTSSPWGFAWRIIVIFLAFAVVDSGIIFLGSASGIVKNTAALSVMLIIASALAGGVFSWLAAGKLMRRLQNEAYLRYLRNLDRFDLAVISRSPELSKDSRDLMIHFLNHNYPGWSSARQQEG